MSGIVVAFADPTAKYKGAKIPVQIFDAASAEVWSKPMPFQERGQRLDRELSPGTYLVRATLPSGEMVAETVAIESDLDVTVVLKSRRRSLRNDLDFVDHLRKAPPKLVETEWPKIAFWTHDRLGWKIFHDDHHSLLAGYEVAGALDGAFLINIQFQQIAYLPEFREQIWLQVTISTASMFAALPVVPRSEFVITANEDEQTRLPFRIHSSSGNPEVDSLLSFLGSGDFESARTVGTGWVERAERMLSEKLEDPMAAAVGGYFLLQAGEFKRLHDWTANLANWFKWLPDGAVIRAYHLMTQVDPNAAAIRDLLLEATRRGLPYYTIGLRMLRNGLKILLQRSVEDTEIAAALATINPYLEAADSPLGITTFSGEDPSHPRAFQGFDARRVSPEEAQGVYAQKNRANPRDAKTLQERSAASEVSTISDPSQTNSGAPISLETTELQREIMRSINSHQLSATFGFVFGEVGLLAASFFGMFAAVAVSFDILPKWAIGILAGVASFLVMTERALRLTERRLLNRTYVAKMKELLHKLEDQPVEVSVIKKELDDLNVEQQKVLSLSQRS